MLSEKLYTLETYLMRVRTGELILTEKRAAHFQACLKDCRQTAEELERRAPMVGELTPEHLKNGTVTIFPISAYRARSKVTIVDPDEGGAA